MRTTVIDHPLAAMRLAVLRAEGTSSAAFRSSLDELSQMLVYEATRDLATALVEVQTPLAATKGVVLVDPPILVPVLRAGLGMLRAAQHLLPDSPVGFVGLARDEETHLPAAYLESLPSTLDGRDVIVLDPMLATGGSLIHCCELLIARGAGHITVVSVLAAPEGVLALGARGLPLHLVTAAIDDRLDDRAFIVPGLGDAGDRQFGAA